MKEGFQSKRGLVNEGFHSKRGLAKDGFHSKRGLVKEGFHLKREFLQVLGLLMAAVKPKLSTPEIRGNH